MSIISVLDEQTSVGFTGKVNLLKKTDGQFLGAVSVREGSICFCNYAGKLGKKALITAIIHEMDNIIEVKTVIEPEVIEPQDGEFRFAIGDLKKRAAKELQKYKTLKKLRPPDHLTVMANIKIFDEASAMNYNNFLVLKSMTEFSRVEDIYKYTNLFEHEVTESLVTLRKKGYVNVVSKEIDQ